MVKKLILVLFIIAALIGLSGMIGYTIGKNQGIKALETYKEEQRLAKENSHAGLYVCEDWNGGQATIILNEDGTCSHPTPYTGWACEWRVDGSKIEFTTNNGEGATGDNTATITDAGLVLGTKFFEKK